MQQRLILVVGCALLVCGAGAAWLTLRPSSPVDALAAVERRLTEAPEPMSVRSRVTVISDGLGGLSATETRVATDPAAGRTSVTSGGVDMASDGSKVNFVITPGQSYMSSSRQPGSWLGLSAADITDLGVKVEKPADAASRLLKMMQRAPSGVTERGEEEAGGRMTRYLQAEPSAQEISSFVARAVPDAASGSFRNVVVSAWVGEDDRLYKSSISFTVDIAGGSLTVDLDSDEFVYGSGVSIAVPPPASVQPMTPETKARLIEGAGSSA